MKKRNIFLVIVMCSQFSSIIEVNSCVKFSMNILSIVSSLDLYVIGQIDLFLQVRYVRYVQESPWIRSWTSNYANSTYLLCPLIAYDRGVLLY